MPRHVPAVFDGHGGRAVSQYCAAHMAEEFLGSEAYKRGDLAGAITHVGAVGTSRGTRPPTTGGLLLPLLQGGGPSVVPRSWDAQRISSNQSAPRPPTLLHI